MEENNGRRKVGIRRGLFYGLYTETGKPPKISFRLVDIWLSEYKTGMLTFRQIAARRLACLRGQQMHC
jgi:hypothetical protein